MEPFRPAVDHAVVDYMSNHDAPYGLEAAATRMAASLADVFLGEAEELELPDFDHFPEF
jgi:hypothetical protein